MYYVLRVLVDVFMRVTMSRGRVRSRHVTNAIPRDQQEYLNLNPQAPGMKSMPKNSTLNITVNPFMLAKSEKNSLDSILMEVSSLLRVTEGGSWGGFRMLLCKLVYEVLCLLG